MGIEKLSNTALFVQEMTDRKSNKNANDLNFSNYQCGGASRPQQRLSAIFMPNSSNNDRMSTSTYSLAESCGNCPLTHQYHYIQYPAHYHYINHQPNAMPKTTMAATTAFHCACAANETQNHSQRQRQQQQQQFLHQHQNHYQSLSKDNSHYNVNTHPQAAQLHTHTHSHQSSVDSQVAVSVVVHTGSGGDGDNTTGDQIKKAKSEQSLLNHSYQTLQMQTNASTNSKTQNSKLKLSCDCDLECTCGQTQALKHRNKPCNSVADAMLGIDEITVSESDNNSSIKKKKLACGNKKYNSWCGNDVSFTSDKNYDTNYNSSNMDIYSEGEAERVSAYFKDNNENISEETDLDQRPPLPPRPMPRPRNIPPNGNSPHRHQHGIKKYVVWCLVCGGFSCIVGILFLGVYFLLHSYTITVGNFETVPTFVPATLLILTGGCIMSLARRKNRYSYLIKLSGACGLISALTCAFVTVTTTVLHMTRLQALRECEYKKRTCTCYSDIMETTQVDRADKEGVRLVFDSLSDCGVVHGSLYSCLRAIFGLSVAGVLIAVFSCMLVYQLLSHERKKMYWEQLELRCRSLYTSQQTPPNTASMSNATQGQICRCCEQCHAHRQLPTTTYPWDDSGEPRFWTGQPPGNFYSPNPGGDVLHHSGQCSSHHNHHTPNASRSRGSGWSWPRMPWQRNNSPVPNTRVHQNLSSPDSQYGFSNNVPAHAENIINPEQIASPHATQQFNVVASSLPYGVWGPPPPYSDPNSPARRGLYHHSLQSHGPAHINGLQLENVFNSNINEQHLQCLNNPGVFLEQANNGVGGGNCCPQTTTVRSLAKRKTSGNNSSVVTRGSLKLKADYENTPSDSDGGGRERFSNTLPTLRKVKKRIDVSAKSIGNNTQQTRISVQQVFPFVNNTNENNLEHDSLTNHVTPEMKAENANILECSNPATNSGKPNQQSMHQHRRRNENMMLQPTNQSECDVNNGGQEIEVSDPTESEVYFADVSSCCNVSVKNDNYYEDANQPKPKHKHSHQNSNCSHKSQKSGSNNEDYLAQRFGHRENSIRSRLPFPQIGLSDEYEENLNILTSTAGNGAVNNVVNLMQKEFSQQSMCSLESEAKTEFTDLSPSTPCSNKFIQTSSTTNETGSQLPHTPTNFVASYIPYALEAQTLEAHRRSTKNIHDLLMATETHYEVIHDNPQQNHKNATQNCNKPRVRTKSKERLDSIAPNLQKDSGWSSKKVETTDCQNL